jgi:hypothetical protein
MDVPVRLRQVPPPRETVEIKTTLDVSRNGLLFRTREPYELQSTIWVTMPYNPVVELRPPEFPATVVRVIKLTSGDLEIGVQFHSAHADRWAHSPVYAREARPPVPSTEKRGKNRVRMTLPIRVRSGKVSFEDSLPTSTSPGLSGVWIEETVTLDVSRTGVLFVSTRPYQIGQKVWTVMPYQPDATAEEEPAEVVRFVERAGVRGVAIRFTGRDVRPY